MTSFVWVIRKTVLCSGTTVWFALAGATLIAGPIEEFDQWIARYEAAPLEARPGLEAEGVRLAKRSQPLMLR